MFFNMSNTSKTTCRRGWECSKRLCKFVHPWDEKGKLCVYDDKCKNASCKFVHKSEWLECEDGESCQNAFCRKKHPDTRIVECNYGDSCTNDNCKFNHPDSRADKLMEYKVCEQNGKCRFGNHCRDSKCKLEHPEPELRNERLVGNSNEKCSRNWKCDNHPERGGCCVRIHTPLNKYTNVPCKWRNRCGNPICPYKHPQ